MKNLRAHRNPVAMCQNSPTEGGEAAENQPTPYKNIVEGIAVFGAVLKEDASHRQSGVLYL
jgi:hypothetical protein